MPLILVMINIQQIAYKSNRGTDDAVLTLLNTVTKHLTNPKGYARILFVDFSSAFNSMKTHLLLKRLVDLNINQGLVLWIRNVLSCRPQRVSLWAMVVHKVVCSPLCCFLFLLMNLQLMRKISDYSNMLMIWPWLACCTKQIRHMIWPTWPTLKLLKLGVVLAN